MNAGKFLVLAVHEIAAAAELAVAAGPAEKSNAYAPTGAPALNTCAGTRGNLMPGKTASTVAESEWQTPHASTRILTCPEAGSMIDLSTSSNLPGFVTCTA